MKNELLPCPLCGASVIFAPAIREGWITCECGLELHRVSRGSAAELWNRRTGMSTATKPPDDIEEAIFARTKRFVDADVMRAIGDIIRAAVEAERAKYRALVKAADAMHGLIRPDSRLDKIHLDCAIEEYEAARKELP